MRALTVIPDPAASSGGCTSGSCSGGSCGVPVPEPAPVDVHAARPDGPVARFTPDARFPQGLMVGLDVGSTTVKAVVIDPATDEILWKEYHRHDTKQPEKCLELLAGIEATFPGVATTSYRIFATGSGGANIARHLGARFVQEVNAVSLAVEKLYPHVGSVVELGGQDAKIIVFKDDPASGSKKKIPSMNDKCAGGTGAVIDKINAKLAIPAAQLAEMGYHGLKLHPVAGKCGVFAETDINGLQKQGVPAPELMASLFESIVQQNLSVLTRGHTLRPTVLLLGGPNCYIRGMRECWQHNIPLIWRERHVELPPGVPAEDLIVVPENAQYFAAIGAVEFAKSETQDDADVGVYQGRGTLQWYVDTGRVAEKAARGGTGLARSAEELAAFRERFRPQPWAAARFEPGTRIEAFIGIDGGSTSTKGVLLDMDRNVIARAYQLSKGNPIEDTMEIVAALEQQIAAQGCTLRVLGVGTTGYAKDMLKDVIRADVAVVETVAHTQAGLHFYPDTDVIVDVGGQDIKLIVLKNGQVKDFKLNTQCSAGNGYFLQSTASGFGVTVDAFAEAAFSATRMPEFGYGCAVFMQSDIVDFQRQGWAPNEILAGLAAVLPKNVWLYVSQVANLPRLGRRFVLQGGTQHNLAAVKAQVDFIETRFVGSGVTPDVVVHRFCGEAGAIGCAIEAHRRYTELGQQTTFIGTAGVAQLTFRTTRGEETRCYFCKNKCLRTFIDVTVDPAAPPVPVPIKTQVPLRAGERRLIMATCEKGTVEDVSAMRDIKKGIDDVRKANPNLAEIASHEAFVPPAVASVAERPADIARRGEIRIGIVRALNIYSTAPFFLGYFQSLGLQPRNLVFSDYTSEALYKEGAKRGAIDPCFPSKIGIPHVHHLLHTVHRKKPLDYVFFPMIDSLPTFLDGVQDSRACPTVTTTPEATKAAFTKESDLFTEHGVVYKHTFIKLNDRHALARELLLDWGGPLGLSPEENFRAVDEGLKALEAYDARMRREARAVLDRLVREDRIGVVLLARPYHNDPGLNHEITDELQKLGYPVLTQDHLPIDEDILESLFGDEVRRGDIRSGLSIDDAWKNSYSENTNRKVWAAKYAARHPNLVALELSSFKCGMDAPVYTVVEEIVENSGTPYFCFKDIDENKPAGAIRIRIETIGYFLDRYREKIVRQRRVLGDIERQLAAFEAGLMASEA